MQRAEPLVFRKIHFARTVSFDFLGTLCLLSVRSLEGRRWPWYPNGTDAVMIRFKSFFSPLARHPKNMTLYAIRALRVWYHAPGLGDRLRLEARRTE